jgi:hypothetical protein
MFRKEEAKDMAQKKSAVLVRTQKARAPQQGADDGRRNTKLWQVALPKSLSP